MERFEEIGAYLSRDGTAKDRGMKNLCKKKLCFFSTDKQFILDLMFEFSQANDCYQVKVRKENRDNVHMGQCYFTNESALGDAWSKYESHPKAWVAIHDDEFCAPYRGNIRTY